ncbi:CgeB family protein [Helcobacillus massiliensis]|uniref:CgeB family protein n=1 Tax=Helcobacillus massiliensis TaxID=521392 RepID=UPI002552C56F|nr:glycosyltransferase [Helcobacillus massiliensis]MDK7741890.1 glycosyltransferase [Helcobacillus massiliensis]WOO92919.1 glycosyltransferase [Helcobacillus massiliensis]
MATTPRGTRLAIITPAFHGYHEAFRAAFEAVGADVTVICYDAFTTITEKIRNKAELELPERLGIDRSAERARRLSAPVIAALREIRPDRVLVIKGDALSDGFWEELEAMRIPTIVWFYDEMRRMQFSDDRIAAFDKIATYSVHDAAELDRRGLTVRHIANGFDTFTPYREIGHRSETTFIGAAYPNRIEAMQYLHDSDVPVRAYGRTWSHDWRDRARTWGSDRPAIPAGRDVSRSVAYGIMRGSLASVNSHFNQDGFTMRTFETPGVGGVHLIDREDIAELYEPDREVLVYRDLDDLVDQVHRLRRDRGLADRLREAGKRRTLAEHTMVHRAREMERFFAA